MLVYRNGNASIYEMPAYVVDGYPPCSEFYAYRGQTLVRVCPSLGMAREVLA